MKLGYVERVFVVTEDMEDQAKNCSRFAEALETRSQSDLFEIFRKPIIRTEDICWITRLHCSPLFEELDGEGSFGRNCEAD